ncbi:MAG TPA: biotin--[acetyl-CoA-carboxylase] ligase, partial [Phenylobacterium sp.]|nr:biotin--[acetyl-CoA-carboxylase] ligase [Phenylobacterium sp.]
PATSFAEHMQTPPPKPREALDLLAAAFNRWLTRWQDEGFAPVAAAWTARAHGLGEPCVARLPGEEVHGVAEGLDPDGALRLRLDDGQIRRITAGDVFFGGA